jgi:RNA polymerase sigma-70 factor (sigma-E family)
MSTRADEEFTEFIAARLPVLRRVAYLLCQDWHRADDLVQIAITRLYAHWGRVAAMEHAEAYVKTIVIRQFLIDRRSGWSRRVMLRAELPEPTGAWPDRDSALDVNAALAALPPRQRATIVLRFYCDLTVVQAAEILGCTPGTVKSQTAKGLDSLRRALEPTQSTGSGAADRIRGIVTATEEVQTDG